MLLFEPEFAPAKSVTPCSRERYSEKLPLVSGLIGDAGQPPQASYSLITRKMVGKMELQVSGSEERFKVEGKELLLYTYIYSHGYQEQALLDELLHSLA